MEARDLGERLRGENFVAAYSSDLQRAIRTAELAGIEQVTTTPLLREFDYGDYEGITTAEIRRQRPGWELFTDGCPGGETPEQAYARAQRFLRELEGLEGAAVAFSHGHFIRTLAVAWTELGIRAAACLALDTASLSVLQDAGHGRVIERWNLRS